MAVANGYGKVVTSGSVFMYDTGDTINSYRGEPTVNYWDGVQYSVYNQDATNYRNQATPFPPTPGYEVVKVVSNTPGSYGHSILWKSPYPNNNVATITNSIYAWLESGTYVQVGQHWFPWYYGTPKYIPAGQWVRISETYAINEGNSYGVAALTYSTDGVAYFTMPQYEYKSHVTPHIGASQTRSATQGLFPIVGNSTINLSNVSFDSNAQVIWDGTDDTLAVNEIYSHKPGLPFTYEVIVTPLGADNGYDKMILGKAGWHTGIMYQNGYTWFRTRYGSPAFYDAGWYLLSPGSYYHLTAVYDPGVSMKFYVNGALNGENTSVSSPLLDIGDTLNIGGSSTNYSCYVKIPVAKVYNRTLSAAEVKQNYNKYKSRFNLS